eukprot:scaffold2.g7271.t1
MHESYGLAKDARMMKLGLHNDTASIIYVSSNSGVVTALVSCHGNVSACELLINQGSPNGIAYANGSLWVATVPALTRWDGVDAAALAGCDAGMLSSSKVADLYPNPGHNSRALALGGDGKLYWGYGSVDNAGVCEPPICSIQRIGLDGSDDTLVNPSSPGLNYEFPYCHWEGAGPPQQRDPGAGWLLADTSTPPPGLEPPPKGQGFNGSFGAWCGTHAAAPVQSLGPHVAPIGLAFYATNASGAFPHEWQGGWFVAEHGSRNRDKRIGYRVAFVALTPEGKAANHSIFVSGWLDDTSQTVWGRPVDVLVMPDSSLLVSDDQAGAVYGAKMEAVALLQEWVRDIGSRAGCTAANTRLNSGSVGAPESRLELEVEMPSLAELERFWASIPPGEHQAWSRRLRELVVHGSPTWELYRTVDMDAPLVAPPSSSSSSSSSAAAGNGGAAAAEPPAQAAQPLVQLASKGEVARYGEGAEPRLPGADAAQTASGLAVVSGEAATAEVLRDWKGDPMEISPGDKLPFRFL